MTDLQALDRQRPTYQSTPGLSGPITTPLHLESWSQLLARHPDQDFKRFIMAGIKEGFRNGCDRKNLCLHRRPQNMPSVRQHQAIVSQYISAERQAGRLVGPISPELQGQCQISPLGLIPKPHQPGKWRLIVYLSSPRGHSDNDGIDPIACLMKYTSVDQADRIVQSVGKGALLSKLELKGAYRMVPIHTDDQPLLGVTWQGAIYVDATLPFGLRSAPKSFSVVPNGITWAMIHRGVINPLHYLTDFLFVSSPAMAEAQAKLPLALSICTELGAPVAP